jgi:hypothetical protein
MQLRTLLFVSFVVACALAQFDGGQPAPKLRGIDKIGIGFDLVTMQLKMSPVELTWLGKTFTSPYDDKDYEIPMEIDSISTPDTFVNRTTNVYNTVDEFRTTKARSTGISLNLGNVFSFTNTKETRQIRFTQDNKNYRYGVTEQQHIFYDVKLFPPFLLKQSYPCREFLRRLPRYSEATKAQYSQFFDYFGTHYVMQAQLGGTVRREELADIRNFTKLDEDYVKTQFGISFSWGTTPASPAPATNTPTNNPTENVPTSTPIATRTTANPGAGGKRHAKINDDSVRNVKRDAGGGGISFGFSFNQMREDLKRQLQIRYSENSSEVTRLLGGNPALYNPDQWRDWVQTIAGNPTIVTYTLNSMADLIQDNPTLQQDMVQAIYDRNNTPR